MPRFNFFFFFKLLSAFCEKTGCFIRRNTDTKPLCYIYYLSKKKINAKGNKSGFKHLLVFHPDLLANPYWLITRLVKYNQTPTQNTKL